MESGILILDLWFFKKLWFNYLCIKLNKNGVYVNY